MDESLLKLNQTLGLFFGRAGGRLDAVRMYYAVMAIALALLVWSGAHYQAAIHLNHDVAWIVHSAAWLLDGSSFGRDIVDPSPPLPWFLSLPAAWAHRQGLADEVTAISVSFWLINVATLIFCFRILAPMVRSGRFIEAFTLAVASCVAVCLLPAGVFGQRDVVACALGLPYLLHVGIQLAAGSRSSTWIGLATGLLAGVGFCLKPYLLVVPALVELYRSASWRDLRLWLRPEVIAMSVVVVAYLGALLLVTPDYIGFALPMIKAAYWAYQGTFETVVQRYLSAVTPAVLAIAMTLATRSVDTWHGILASGVVGASISYWIQNKGFAYHAYPIVAMSFILLSYTLVVAVRAAHRQLREVSLSLSFVVVFALLYLGLGSLQSPLNQARAWFRAYDRAAGEQGQEYEALINRLRALGVGPGTYLYAISTHPKPGFPATSYLGANWAGEAATQFVLPAYARRNEIADSDQLKRVTDAAEYQREVVIRSLDRHRPRVVLLDARRRRLGLGFRRFDQVAFYAENDRFRRIWACYVELKPVGPVRIFELQNPACLYPEPE